MFKTASQMLRFREILYNKMLLLSLNLQLIATSWVRWSRCNWCLLTRCRWCRTCLKKNLKRWSRKTSNCSTKPSRSIWKVESTRQLASRNLSWWWSRSNMIQYLVKDCRHRQDINKSCLPLWKTCRRLSKTKRLLHSREIERQVLKSSR